MTALQMGLTIAVCTAATMIARFLPFVVFSSKDQQPPEVVRYLGRVLPAAIFGMLIVYCLKSVTPFAGSHGIPEAIALLVTVALHKWKHETLLSVAGGTLCYVLLVQLVFSKTQSAAAQGNSCTASLIYFAGNCASKSTNSCGRVRQTKYPAGSR